MIDFSECLSHYPSKEFSRQVKAVIEQCDRKQLPLEGATTQGGYISDEAITATILRVTDEGGHIQVLAGIFFTEIVICCGCGDDPMLVNAYGEMFFSIDKLTAETEIRIVQE